MKPTRSIIKLTAMPKARRINPHLVFYWQVIRQVVDQIWKRKP